MLKKIHVENSNPIGITVDMTAEFEPGMIGQLKVIGNDIACGVSDGSAPIGIIDDVRTSSFTKAQVNEVVDILVNSTEIDSNGRFVNSEDVTGFLENPSVIERSFVSTIRTDLNSVNGAIIVRAGTELNYDSDGDGTFDSIRAIVSYNYRVHTKPGDDSTLSSGKLTIHYARGFYATDQFDPTQIYPLNATLYVGLDGKLTTRQITSNHPGVAIVTGPPSSLNSTLEFLWL
jgi:hypothetical protein